MFSLYAVIRFTKAISGIIFSLLMLWGCGAPERISEKPSLQHYRVRTCYDVECDRLKRYGPTAFQTPIYRSRELCSNEDCERLDEYGPNNTSGLAGLKLQVKEKLMLTPRQFKK
ncbi:MAG: hypothetical protein HQM14_06850 [SAR324 cluster bacterium]|nr:hypothetical protein [SAR324 cluster bacterium]